MHDTSRLAIHTITTKPWPVEKAIDKFAEAGARGISVWKEALEGRKAAAVGERIRKAGLRTVATVRGGFFAALSPEERKKRIDDNRALVDLSAELGSPMIVLVPGAHPGQELEESRRQIRDGIAEILPYAEKAGVRLAIEPLHPMYADARSAVNTLKQANDLCVELDHPGLGVAIDVYHLFWDPDLEREIARCGAMGRIFAFHVCDWKTPTTDFLNDRGLMGEGCIAIPKIRRWVEAAGFDGLVEVEIFSDRYWAMDQDDFLGMVVKAFREHV
jgi:sugar phosphate isomerase/epimerase